MNIRHSATMDITAALASIDQLSSALGKLDRSAGVTPTITLHGIPQVEAQIDSLVAKLGSITSKSSVLTIGLPTGTAQRAAQAEASALQQQIEAQIVGLSGTSRAAKESASAFRSAFEQERLSVLDTKRAIDQVKLSYSQARQTLDQNFLKASTFSEIRTVTGEYRDNLAAVSEQIALINERQNLTLNQTRQLVDLEARMARELTTLENRSTAVGLSGNVAAALNTAGYGGRAATGGSLGAASVESARAADAALGHLNLTYDAGRIKLGEYRAALSALEGGLKTDIIAIEAEMRALQGQQILHADERLRLAELTAQQEAYARSLINVATAQTEAAAAARSASLSGRFLNAAGGRGANNVAMAASFLPGVAGEAGMLATLGPTTAAVAGLGLAVAATGKFFGDSAKEAANFDRELQQIQGLSHLDSASINEFGQYVQELDSKLPVGQEQLAEFGRQAVLVGLHGAEGIKTFTTEMANLDVILRDVHGNTPGLEEVGQETVKILRSMGMSTEEVNANFGKTINSMVALKTEFGAQIPEVTNLATYFSSYASKIGLTTDQILGFSAALVSVGARAQGSGSQLTKFFEKASAASAQGGAPLKAFAQDLGLSEEATRQLLKTDPAGFLQRFATRLNDLHEQGIDSSIVLKGLGLDTNQAARTFNELAVAAPNTARALGIANKGFNDTGLALRTALAASDNYADKVKILDQMWTNFKTNVGQLVLPTLGNFISDLTDGMKVLNDLARNGRLKDYFEDAALGVGVLTTAMILNSKWAKAMFEADALAAGSGAARSVLGGLTSFNGGAIAAQFTKIVGGVKDLQTAFALASSGGVGGVLKLLGAIPVAAGAALAGIALLAGGIALYGKKIADDTRAIYSQTDQAANESFEKMMAQVKELRTKGGDLNNAKANLQIAIYQQANNDDPARAAALAQRVKELRQEITLLTTEQARHTTGQQAAQSEVKKTSEAYGVLSDKLVELNGKFTDTKQTSFQKNLDQSRQSLEAFNKEIQKALALGREGKDGGITEDEAARLRRRRQNVAAQDVSDITSQQHTADLKTIEGHQREIESARFAVIKDGRLKREGEYANEVQALKDTYAPQIAEALQNAQTRGLTSSQKNGFLRTAGQLQTELANAEKVAQAKLNSDLEQLDEDRAKKIRDGHASELSALASEMDGRTRLVQQQYDHELSLAEGDVAAELAVRQKFGPLLEAQETRARQAKYIADQAALKNQLDDALLAARNQGDATGKLQEEARRTYLTNSRTLEQAYLSDVQGYHLATLDAIQKAGAEVSKKQLDLDLQGVKQWSGAQLEAYATMLRAKMAVAQADGDGPRYKVLADALKQISDQKFQNLADFKKNITEAGTGLTDLRAKLDDLNPNKDARRAAESAAAKPFDSLISDAQKRLTGNQQAFDKLDPAQQRQQLAAYQRQQAELNRFVLDANRQRNTAIAAADADFEEKRVQKAEAASLKLAKTDYDRSKDSGPYLLALSKDDAFWQARLKIAEDGSQAQQDAEQHLSDNDSARKALLDADLARSKERQQMTRDELQGSLDLARTDAERTRLRAQLLAQDQLRLAQLPAEIDASEKIPGNEEKTNALKREQISLRKSIQQAADEEVGRADALLASQLKLLEAQHGYAAAVAQTNAQVIAGKQQAILDTQAEADQIANVISQARERGLTEAQIDDKKAELLAKQTSVYEQQKSLREYLHSLDRDSLSLLESQIKLRATASGAINDPRVAQQLDIDAGARQIAELRREMDDQPEEERVKTQTTINGLLADQITKRRDLAKVAAEAADDELKKMRQLVELDFQRQQSEVGLAQARSKAALQISGMADDAVAAARLDLQISQQNLEMKRREIQMEGQAGPSGNSPEDAINHEIQMNNLLAQEAALTGQVAEGQRKLAQAEKDRQKLLESLPGALDRVNRAAMGAGDLGPAMNEFDRKLGSLLRTGELAQKAFSAAGEGGKAWFNLNDTRVNYWDSDRDLRLASFTSQIETAKLQVSSYTQLQKDFERNRLEVIRTEAEGIGRILLPALAAERDAREATAQAAAEYADAKTAYLFTPSTTNMEKLKTASSNLTTAIESQRNAVKGLADAYRTAVGNIDSIRSSAEHLRQTVYGDVGADLKSTADSVRSAQQKLQEAQKSGKRGEIAQAQRELAAAEARLREVQSRINGSLEVDRLSAIEARRQAAITAANAALASGDQARIAQTLQDLDTVEKRYRDQAEMLRNAGYNVKLVNEDQVISILNASDRLGIHYDREAAALLTRAAQIDQEAQGINQFGVFVQEFNKGVDNLKGLPDPKIPSGPLPVDLEGVKPRAVGFPKSAATQQATPILPADLQAVLMAALKPTSSSQMAVTAAKAQPSIVNNKPTTVNRTMNNHIVINGTNLTADQVGNIVVEKIGQIDREAQLYGECPV